ncbi:putative glutamine-tRNA ligase [Tilletiaria anomala UBC 951]|uniref:glutamine--tRNA ligase n=1 Tax=Tilletiaria anomala (strain ATCC 24038 / CBS 436.72 / UBC 951) TaxID=1037660 RepID=A0A066W3G2_TILAU|nr:putative glutamine-tRNA ligase [Tilletiaria anomala UBC 951]KDN48497.1 putative glutamine-tRNA ligase [Tilletiaria anomala UBC 951]
MASKAVPLPKEEADELAQLFADRLSFTGAKAKDLLKKPPQAKLLAKLVAGFEIGSSEAKKIDSKAATLVVTAATNPTAIEYEKREYIVKRILDGSLKSNDQVNAACKFLEGNNLSVEDSVFDHECGVGVVISRDQIKEHVDSYISANKESIDAALGWGKHQLIMASLRSEPALRWANALDIKNETDSTLETHYGDRNAAMAKLRTAEKEAKDKAKTAGKDAKAASTAKASDPHKGGVAALAGSADRKDNVLRSDAEPIRPDAMFTEGFLSRLHKPGENPQCKPELKEQHLKMTSGRVVTRFPPEPNGFLHIGHTKAIAIDFGYAKHHGGLTYLRFDDTNPEAEEEKYFESILEVVRWLGFEPFKVTYSSDYFDRLYELAVELIKRGKAYVDHSTPEEVKEERGGEAKGPRHESRYRNQPIEASLKDFEDMKNGKYRPGQCTLRMKQDILGNGNPQMWDLIAYRVLDAAHHRTGTKWCIYPTYDFTHCLVDSFENISHSLCTTEFQQARESYEWLCDALEVYKPRQYEFGRLSLEGTITSKRKLLKVIQSGLIKDWDDPRLYTIIALRRRGIPPGALLAFVNQLGVSTSPALTTIDRFEWTIRQHLEATTPRLMMVLDPVKVVIEDLPEDYLLQIKKPLHPKVTEMGMNTVPFTRTVYIDASDFREVDSKDYFRLAPGKTVGLLNTPEPITAVSYEKDASTGKVTLVRCKTDKSGKKPKTWIQWVGEHKPSGSPVVIDEARIFHRLFTVSNPGAEDDILSTLDRNSLEVHKGAMIETGFWTVAARAFAGAQAEAEERSRSAEKMRSREAQKEAGVLSDLPASSGEGAPKSSTGQLVGNEVVRFQAMRIAYFTVDREAVLPALDSADKLQRLAQEEEGSGRSVDAGNRIVLNRIISLKEDKAVAGTK